mgnify:CR=1 FL=1
MEFHAPTGEFTVSHQKMEHASYLFLHAMAKIRKLNNLPLVPYEREGLLQDVDHAQNSIIEAARALGINLGAQWCHELDLTKFEN